MGAKYISIPTLLKRVQMILKEKTPVRLYKLKICYLTY
jgi:hypothetical protein